MTFAEFLNRLIAIAGGRYCHAQVGALFLGSENQQKPSVKWRAYVDRFGSTDQVDGLNESDPEAVLEEMRGRLHGMPTKLVTTDPADVGAPAEGA